MVHQNGHDKTTGFSEKHFFENVAHRKDPSAQKQYPKESNSEANRNVFGRISFEVNQVIEDSNLAGTNHQTTAKRTTQNQNEKSA